MQSTEDILARDGLTAVLERLDVPTFIARRDGVVRFTNALGRARRERDPATLETELRTAISGERPAKRYVCTPLAIDGWYLVSAPGEASTDECVERVRKQYKLTVRHRDVLELLVVGATNRTIGEILGITERTVEVHLTAIYERVGVENRATLVARVLRSA